jgi:hypothetical protein
MLGIDSAPTMATVYPEWKTLSDRIQVMFRREETLLGLIAASVARQRVRDRSVMQSSGVNVVYPPKPAKPLSDAARALLDEFAPAPADEKSSNAGPVIEYTRQCDIECAPLAAELTSIREAKAVIHPLLTAAHREASKRLCAARLGEYRAHAAKLCGALVDLGDALIAHREFHAELTATGAPDFAYFRPMDVAAVERALGNPSERYALLRRLLHSAAEGGHFDLTAIPDAWSAPPAGGAPGTVAPATAARRTRGAAVPAAVTVNPEAPAASPEAAPNAPAGGAISAAWRSLIGDRATIVSGR